MLSAVPRLSNFAQEMQMPAMEKATAKKMNDLIEIVQAQIQCLMLNGGTETLALRIKQAHVPRHWSWH